MFYLFYLWNIIYCWFFERYCVLGGVDIKVKDLCYMCFKGGENLERDKCGIYSNF